MRWHWRLFHDNVTCVWAQINVRNLPNNDIYKCKFVSQYEFETLKWKSYLMTLCLQGSCLPVNQPSLWCQLASELIFMPALRERAAAPVSSATASRPLPPLPLPPRHPRTDRLPHLKLLPNPAPFPQQTKGRLLNSPDCMFFVSSDGDFLLFLFYTSSSDPYKVNLLNSTSMRKTSIRHDRILLAARIKHVHYTYIYMVQALRTHVFLSNTSLDGKECQGAVR